MKLEMSTCYFNLIEPGLYGTTLGDQLEYTASEYIDTLKNAVVNYCVDKLNEIFSEEELIKEFGIIKVFEGKLTSPLYYNFENDTVEFTMEIPDITIKKLQEKAYTINDFYKFTSEKYGSHEGFISFFPYQKEKFIAAINGKDISRAEAMYVQYYINNHFNTEDILRWQLDFEDDVIEEGNRNGWFEFEEDR